MIIVTLRFKFQNMIKTFICLSFLITIRTSLISQPVSTDENWQPTVTFVETEHIFGEIPEGPKVYYDFSFKNTGKEIISIERAQASCGCTEPEVSKEPVKPGAVGTIKVGYNTEGRPGNFEKTITVFVKGGMNGEKSGTVMLKIKGNVSPKKTDNQIPDNQNHENHNHEGHNHEHNHQKTKTDSLMVPSLPQEVQPVSK